MPRRESIHLAEFHKHIIFLCHVVRHVRIYVDQKSFSRQRLTVVIRVLRRFRLSLTLTILSLTNIFSRFATHLCIVFTVRLNQSSATKLPISWAFYNITDMFKSSTQWSRKLKSETTMVMRLLYKPIVLDCCGEYCIPLIDLPRLPKGRTF